MFKRILFATDFSPHAEIAKRFAMRMAQADYKQLWVMTVLDVLEEPLHITDEPPLVSTKILERELEKEEQELEREEERMLRRDVAEMESSNIRVHKIVREGDPAEEVVTVARDIGADLIVIGSHSHRTIWDVELGSTATKITKYAPCPVLIVSHRPPHPGLIHERILYAADFSSHAEQGFKIALTLAKETQGKIWLVSVLEHGKEIPMPPGFEVEVSNNEVSELKNELRADVEAEVREKLSKLAEKAKDAGVQTEILIRHGHVSKEIRKAAVDIEADLIVMGTHSRFTIWDKLLGKTAQNVAQHASCPVLLVSNGKPNDN